MDCKRCLAVCALLLHIYRNAPVALPHISFCFSSLGPRRKAYLMESEKGKIAAATNDTVGRPWNILLEQHMRSLLSTLGKNELVDLHVKLGMTIPQAAEEIRGAARPDPAHRKLFVYGFGEETTSETLFVAFSSYGEIEEGRVVVDDATGKSRRFGFIIFKNVESVPKALEREGTMLDGRLAFHHPALEGFDCALATANVESRRLYVADVSTDITTEMFLCFFEKYGEIEEGSVICDRRTGTSRGFGFVTFKTSQAAMNAITDPEKNLGRNRISVRFAQIRRFRGMKKQVQESVTYAPQVHSNSPSAIAPQHYGSPSPSPTSTF